MSLSPEVKQAVDEIRRNKSLTRSLMDALALLKQKIADLQAKIDAMPVEQPISQDDKDALTKEAAELDALNDELESAIKANTGGGDGGGNGAAAGRVEAVAPAHEPEAARPDPIAGTGAAGSVPLMPNMAFDPDPTGARGIGDGGQPNQPAAIETAGGFVVSGGGTTQRAPGSRPESPSSSQVVPLDPDAKGPASTADEAKSGLGDSSQNALLGNDGQPIGSGPGIPQELTDAEREAAQKQADLVEKERAAREANPLNLAPAGTPQAGSPEAEKAALDQRQQEQREAMAAEQGRNDDQQGKPAPGAPGPDPVSALVETPEQRAERDRVQRESSGQVA